MCSSYVSFLLLLLHSFLQVHAYSNVFDFVIVGAGTSGCALAARLCASLPYAKIALLERAPPRDVAAEFLVRSPRQVWNAWESRSVCEIFPTLPSPFNANKTPGVITGNTLGGSSAINSMQWVVPIEGTVERWGIRGLSTKTSMKYYRRAHVTVGFKAQQRELRHKYAAEYIESAIRAGFKANRDPFDVRNRRDVFENRLAVDSKGRRQDSCTAYLTPALRGACKSNLRLIHGATATRILLSYGRRPRATGVEYVRSSDKRLTKKMKIYARKEVLVCAGPFGSPKLLQLSGIGPRKVLQKAGIKPAVESPVGQKTYGRPFVSIVSKYDGVPLEPSNNSTLLNSPESRRQWESGNGGVLGISPFFSNGRDKKDSYTTGVGNFGSGSIDKGEISSACNGNVDSSGFFKIKDSNPFSVPEVSYSFLSKQVDVDRFERCLNRLVRIHRNFPKRFKASFVTPPNGVITQAWIRKNANWAGHYVGGCAVGSVLKPDMKVKGTRRLRVIDSSSLNTLPTSAGPMASVYMLAEYMSDVIARRHR